MSTLSSQILPYFILKKPQRDEPTIDESQQFSASHQPISSISGRASQSSMFSCLSCIQRDQSQLEQQVEFQPEEKFKIQSLQEVTLKQVEEGDKNLQYTPTFIKIKSPQKPSIAMHQTPQPLSKTLEQNYLQNEQIQPYLSPLDKKKTPAQKLQRPMRPEPYQDIRRNLNLQYIEPQSKIFDQNQFRKGPQLIPDQQNKNQILDSKSYPQHIQQQQPQYSLVEATGTSNEQQISQNQSFKYQYPHNTRITDANRISRVNIKIPQPSYSSQILHNPYSFTKNRAETQRLSDWGQKNQYWERLNKNLENKRRMGKMQNSQDQNQEPRKLNQKGANDLYDNTPLGNEKRYSVTEQKQTYRKWDQDLDKDESIRSGDQINKSKNQMILPRDQRVSKPLINVQSQIDSNKKKKSYNRQDLKTHKVQEDIDRLEIQQYLNQGSETIDKSLMSQSHPNEKIDPEIEQHKDEGNYNYEVCQPEEEGKGMTCDKCINHELILQHEQAHEQENEEQFLNEIDFLESKLGNLGINNIHQNVQE